MGSSYIAPALWSVRRKGFDVELIRVRGRSKPEALKLAGGLLDIPCEHLDAVPVLDLVKVLPPRPALLGGGAAARSRPQAVQVPSRQSVAEDHGPVVGAS